MKEKYFFLFQKTPSALVNRLFMDSRAIFRYILSSEAKQGSPSSPTSVVRYGGSTPWAHGANSGEHCRAALLCCYGSGTVCRHSEKHKQLLWRAWNWTVGMETERPSLRLREPPACYRSHCSSEWERVSIKWSKVSQSFWQKMMENVMNLWSCVSKFQDGCPESITKCSSYSNKESKHLFKIPLSRDHLNYNKILKQISFRRVQLFVESLLLLISFLAFITALGQALF